MMPVIRIDDDVLGELQSRAVEFNLVFGTPNQVLRQILGLERPKEVNDMPNQEQQEHGKSSSYDDQLRSSDPAVQEIINGLKLPLEHLLHSSGNRLMYHRISEKWVAHPNNFVAIKVQEARAKNLYVAVYGTPDDFSNFASSLQIKRERSRSYSGFRINKPDQVAAALQVIKRAYDIKAERGR